MEGMKKFILMFVLITAVSLSVTAENLTPESRRNMFYDILNLINRYEECLPMLDPSDADAFLGLFEDENSMVYNDLLSVTTGRSLTAKQYSDALRTEMYPGCRFVIKDISHDEPAQSGNLWVVNISFQKELLYYDDCNIKYSSKEYYEADYDIIMTIIWNPENRLCKIRRISGRIDSQYQPLPDGFVVLDLTDDPRYSSLLYNGYEMNYNVDSIVFLGSDALEEEGAISYPYDDDVILKVSKGTECDRKIGVGFKTKHRRIRIHYEQNEMSDMYKIESKSNNYSFKSKGYEVGIDYGKNVVSKNSVKLGFYIGAGIAQNTIDAKSLKSVGYSYKSNGEADLDGDPYVRFYTVNNSSYSVSIMDVVVPLYIDLNLRISPLGSLYFDVGVKGYYNVKRSISDFSASYTTYGKYSQYGNLELNANNTKKYLELNGRAYNGFVNNGTLDNYNLNEKKIDMPQYSIDAFGGVGLRFRLSRRNNFMGNTYLDMGVTYQYTLTPYKSSLDKSVASQNGEMIKYYVNSGERVEKNISHYVDNLTRNGSIRAKLSLIYRF